jgi:hypothetical protein
MLAKFEKKLEVLVPWYNYYCIKTILYYIKCIYYLIFENIQQWTYEDRN